MRKAIDWFIYFIFFFFPIISILYITDVLAMHYIVGFIPFISTMLIVILFLIKKFKSSIKDNIIMVLLILSVVSVPLSSILCAVKPYRFHTERVENGIEVTGYSVNWINDYKKEFIIKLPSTIRNKEVISIGSYAFSSCPYFDELVIPEGVKVIKERAFSEVYYCKLILPETLLEIEEGAFERIRYSEQPLEYIILPKNLEKVGRLAFNYTTKNIFVHFSETKINEKKWGDLWPWYYGGGYTCTFDTNGKIIIGHYSTKVYYDVKHVDIKDEYYEITYNDGTTETKLKNKS